MVCFRNTLIILLVFVSCLFFGAAEDFEDLDWEVRYPDVIFQDREAILSVGTGFYTEIVDEEVLGGLYIHLEPEMKFLMFEGSFHIGLRTAIKNQELFLDFENRHPSDYFRRARFKYKELQFLFGESVPVFMNQFYGPYLFLGEPHSAFYWDWENWSARAASLSWNNWAVGLTTPELSWHNGGLSGMVDGYFDWSASETYAISAGPSFRWEIVSFTPMVSFITPELFGGGAKIGLEWEELAIHTGLQWIDRTMFFINLQLGPVGFSMGEKPFLREGQMTHEAWRQVALEWSDEIYQLRLGFGNRQLIETPGEARDDWYFRIQNTWNMSDQWQIRTDIRLMQQPIISVGVAYRMRLEM